MNKEIPYLSKQILSTDLYLDPYELNNDVDIILNTKLKDKYENKCINEGYIIQGSIQIINKSLGKLKTINSESKIIYNVKYESILLYPNENDIINCYVDNYNKMGIIAYVKLSEIYKPYKGDNNLSDSPFIIIIPNDSLQDKNYNLNEKIKIKVKATRIKYHSPNIQIIGEIV